MLILRITSIVFCCVTILHLLRIVTGIPVLIGDFLLPVYVNWVGMILTGIMAFFLWRFSSE
jgi:hypothetical protein